MLQQFYPQPNAHDYRFELNIDMDFSAAHFIPNQETSRYTQVHGHTFFVNITVAGNRLDDTGFLVNLLEVKELIHGRYDHTTLNNHQEYHFNLEEYNPLQTFPTKEITDKPDPS